MKNLVSLVFVTILSLNAFSSSTFDGIDPTWASFQKWTKSIVQYPTESAATNEQGLVLVSFEIAEDGTMTSVEVSSNLSESLEQKAVEMVTAMPKEHLYENGFIEGTRFVLPVKFVIQ